MGARSRGTAHDLVHRPPQHALSPDHLREAGFADVSVEGAGETRLAEATWPLDDATAPLPPQVASVSESKDG
jgi:hypothetical protein